MIEPVDMIIEAFNALREYCEKEHYKGWDPYDGLNSRVFQSTPLKHLSIARLALIQACKRSPVNIRPLLFVPKEHNSKGIGLFLNGYCNLLRLAKAGVTCFGTEDSLASKVDELAKLLVQMQCRGYAGACWGYNFDWQARRLFFFPANTPTVVATAFCSSALFNAYEVTSNSYYLETAVSSSEFVLRNLRRTPHGDGLLLSYSPVPGNDTVYNASLLGAKILSYSFHYTEREECRSVARQIVAAACHGQNEDGSWVYGLLPVQSWIDSFHTGYNIDAISHYMKLCGDGDFGDCLERGLKFYLSRFFLDDGTPKYYQDRVYPIDIHCPAQLFVTLSVVNKFEENKELASRVLDWTLVNMRDRRGFFYYQLKRMFSSKISYMRWSNAFMFNAMSYYLIETYGQQAR